MPCIAVNAPKGGLMALLLERPNAATDRIGRTVPQDTSSDVVLDVRHLMTSFPTHAGWLDAVNDVSFTVPRGKVLAILGESGSGKSAMLRSILGVQPRNARIAGQALMNDVDLLS